MIDISMQDFFEDVDIQLKEIDATLLTLQLAADRPDLEGGPLEYSVSGIRRRLQSLQDYLKESVERIEKRGVPCRKTQKVA